MNSKTDRTAVRDFRKQQLLLLKHEKAIKVFAAALAAEGILLSAAGAKSLTSIAETVDSLHAGLQEKAAEMNGLVFEASGTPKEKLAEVVGKLAGIF